MDYITWTYFFRRLIMNPSYYDLDSVEHDNVNKYLSTVVQGCIGELEGSSCLEVEEVTFSFLCSNRWANLETLLREHMFPSVGILGNIFVRDIGSHESCTFLIRKTMFLLLETCGKL